MDEGSLHEKCSDGTAKGQGGFSIIDRSIIRALRRQRLGVIFRMGYGHRVLLAENNELDGVIYSYRTSLHIFIYPPFYRRDLDTDLPTKTQEPFL